MNVNKIKLYLLSKLHCPIKVIYFGSRNKKEKYIGEVYNVYNRIFSIKLATGQIKSFKFADILTKTVQIYI